MEDQGLKLFVVRLVCLVVVRRVVTEAEVVTLFSARTAS